MKSIKVSRGPRWWATAAAVFAGLLMAVAIRYGILENEAQDLMCREGISSFWCSVRSATGWAIHYQLFGLIGLFLGIAGCLPRLRWLAYPGLLLAGCGLLIYNATYAAVAVVIALLAALQPTTTDK